MKRLIAAHYDGSKKDTSLTTYYLVVLLSAITSLTTFTTLVFAQDEPDKPLSELGSFPKNDPTNQLDFPGVVIGNEQTGSTEEKSNYEEFLGCLSDSIQEEAEASVAKRIVNDCFNLSYIEDETRARSKNSESDERGDGLPELH